MAKSTFLALVTEAHRDCGLSGSRPTTVLNQTGVIGDLISWVMRADLETQSRWFDWSFLHVRTWSAATSSGVADVSAPDNVGTWDEESFYLDYSTASNRRLPVLDYRLWRRDYRQGVKDNRTPAAVVIMPDLSLKLEPPPDAAYTLTADYWKKPVAMTTNESTSPIPEEYERIIVERARMMCAEANGDTNLMLSAQVAFDDLLDKLESKYLPGQAGRRRGDYGQMVVRPE